MIKKIQTLLIVSAAVVLCLLPNIKSAASATPPARTAAQIYSRYCVGCHGRDGSSQTSKGKYSHARDMTDAKWQDDVTDERIFNSIINGRNVRGTMPGFKDKINEQEAESLVTMVRGFRK